MHNYIHKSSSSAWTVPKKAHGCDTVQRSLAYVIVFLLYYTMSNISVGYIYSNLCFEI